MIKVDLHLHSINSNKTGDSVSWLSLEDTINKIKNEGIRIFSFTDHDMFNYNLYKDAQMIIKKESHQLLCFPGLELTVIRENLKRGHVLFIFNNNDEDKIKQLSEITYDITFSYKNGIKLTKAVEIYNKLELDYFIIPHVDKSDFLIYEDMENVKEKIYYLEAYATSREFKKFKKEATEIKVKPVKFSDHHHWRDKKFTWSGTYLDQYNTFLDLKYNLKLKEENDDLH